MNARRLVDLIAAGLLAVVAAPLLIILALVNRVRTGHVLFRQVRVGQDLRPFMLFKFQTMRDGSDAGSTVTVAHDTRITPYGRLLRASKLDELPQLMNILRGEMTLVGPRPLTPNEVQAMPQHLAALVYRAQPGLTGASAVAFADEERLLARFPEPERVYFERVLPRKIALELAYAHRHTWVTDLILLLLSPLAASLPRLRRHVIIRLVPEWEALADDESGGGRMLSRGSGWDHR